MAFIDVADKPTLDKVLKEAFIAEHHLHNRERWFGISGDQSGNNWALAGGLTPFQAISGNGDFGGDADDEAKVIGTEDTPAISGMIKYDLHRIVILDQSSTTAYILRVIYGTGTMAAAEAAGQYTDIVVISNSAIGIFSGGAPADVLMPRLNSGIDQLWIKAKNATDNATVDFLVGIHEYSG